MRIRRPGEPVEVDDSGARSWYASADLTTCAAFEEQDPDLYRLMAAPRGIPAAEPEPALEAATWEIGDGEGAEGFEELDTVLPEDLDPIEEPPPIEPSRTLDELLYAQAAGADAGEAPDDAGDLATLDDLLVAPLDPEEAPTLDALHTAPGRDPSDEPQPLDDDSITALDDAPWLRRAATPPRWQRALEEAPTPRRRAARPPSPLLVPAYELQCGQVDPALVAEVRDRSTPSRIARRLWQRDLDRIHA